MRKLGLIVAAAMLVGAGYLATGVQADAKQACKAQKSEAACTGTQGCSWDGAKNKCQKAAGSKKTK